MKHYVLTLCVLAMLGCQRHDHHDAGRSDIIRDLNNDDSDDSNKTEEEKGKIVLEKRVEESKRLDDAVGPTAQLVVLETTDMHVNMEAFDYYKDAPSTSVGFVRTASVIRQKRNEYKNTVLVDNGDLIQGTPLGDFLYQDRGTRTDPNTVYKAMNLLGYDVGNIGNHEFNYGLEYLRKQLPGANFPYVSANVYVDDGDQNPDNDAQLVKPYLIKEHVLITDDGKAETIKVGYIGFVPPQIMIWDRSNLTGKLRAADIYDTAKKYVPLMKQEGADVIVAIPHSGINASPRQGNDENAVYYLSQVEGINAIMSGHSHQVFPSDTYKNIPNTDLAKGLINGVPTVMAGSWGSHLGIVSLNLKKVDGHWQVISGTGETVDVRKLDANMHEQDVRDAIKADHLATIDYLKVEVGDTSKPIHSYFSQLAPSAAVQVVNDAQMWYGKKTMTDGIPVLSAFAPLKAGGTPNNFTEVPPGRLSRRSISDLYVYPNTLMIVKMKGAEVKDWLEMAAGAFNQIDPKESKPQELINRLFPGYNFDVMAGLEYEIDVTQPSRYDSKGKLLNPQAERVLDIKFAGKALDLTQDFYVVTNNYRASGGGGFPGLNGSQIVHDSTRESRAILQDYVTSTGDITATRSDSKANHWHLKPLQTAGPIIYRTAERGRDFAAELGNLVTYQSSDASGWAYFQINWNANKR